MMKQQFTIELKERGILTIPKPNRLAGKFKTGDILKLTAERINVENEEVQ